MKLIKRKIYWNKRNGQGTINIPKKYFSVIPDKIELKIPKDFLKKKIRRKNYAL